VRLAPFWWTNKHSVRGKGGCSYSIHFTLCFSTAPMRYFIAGVFMVCHLYKTSCHHSWHSTIVHHLNLHLSSGKSFGLLHHLNLHLSVGKSFGLLYHLNLHLSAGKSFGLHHYLGVHSLLSISAAQEFMHTMWSATQSLLHCHVLSSSLRSFSTELIFGIIHHHFPQNWYLVSSYSSSFAVVLVTICHLSSSFTPYLFNNQRHGYSQRPGFMYVGERGWE